MSVSAQPIPPVAPTRDLPTFIVIGAMKAGTTSLYHYLRNHDQIFKAKIKELDFFAEKGNLHRGMDWYRNQFSDAGDALARGEASTLYSKYPEHDGVPARIAAALPDVRLIYVVRDPIVRLRSHYEHRVKTGAETAPPETALFDNPIYLDTSRYGMQLEQYLDHFPREQVLVVTSEGLKAQRRATVQQVYSFLGVDPGQVPDVLDQEFYRTAQRRTYPPAVWWARRMAKRYLPRSARAKEVVDHYLSRRGVDPAPAPEEAYGPLASDVFSPQLCERLADLLRDDVAVLRKHMPPDFDGWGLA
jgi:hypothetical protein